MPIYRDPGSPNWWIRISVAGRKTRRSTGTTDRRQAEEFEQRERERLWRLHKLGDRGAHRFAEAASRWLTETTKKTKAKDEELVAWFEQHIKDEPLSAIDMDAIEELRQLALEDDMKPATVDRHMALLRAILRKAAHEWRWLDSVPKVPMFRAPTPEPRWLNRQEFARLCAKLPKHLELAARFAVLTMLRMRSMTGLTWDRIDLKARRAWVPGMQMKAAKAHGIPLSRAACEVLRELRELNPDGTLVFQWRGKRIDRCSTKAWRKAVTAAKVGPLRWHDLRHTGASWAVQNGVTLQELMALGGWSSYSMVLRYAHLAPDHLALAAEKMSRNGAERKSAGRRKSLKAGGKGGTRTLDPGIMRAADHSEISDLVVRKAG